MSVVVHHQRPVGHVLLYQPHHIGITVARRSDLAVVGIPHYLPHIILRMVCHHHVGHPVGRDHVHIVVSVVAHEHNSVLPRPCIGIAHILLELVEHYAGLGCRPDGEAADGHVGLSVARIAAVAVLDGLAIVEHAIEIVRHIAVYVVVRVVTLETEQEVVGRVSPPSLCDHAVVPGAIAEQNEILGHVGLSLGAVV